MKKLRWKLISSEYDTYHCLVSTNHSWDHDYRIMHCDSSVITNPKYKAYYNTETLTKYALPIQDVIAAANKHNGYFTKIKSVGEQKRIYANNILENVIKRQDNEKT